MAVGSRAILERVTQRLRGVYGGRSWLVATDETATAAGLVRALRTLGADRCLVIAATEGTGERPDPADAEVHVLGVPAGGDAMTAIRRATRALAELPPAVVAAVDAFDRYGRLRTIGNIFSDGAPVAGRAGWGARPSAWRALEDKTRVDALWDAVGVRRAPSEVVPLDADALAAASRRLDAGRGTVWAADDRLGFHGGATYTRPVRDDADAAAAIAAFADAADRVRVMPLLPGLPCSLAGIVLPDAVLSLRPAELLVLGRPDGGFAYLGVATTWRAPATLEAELRDVVARVGAHLRATLGYRGAFVVDGIATPDGFLPTELNPRMGASVAPQAGDFPLALVNLALVEGLDVVVDGASLEAALRATAAERPFARAMVPLASTPPRSEHALAWAGDRFERARRPPGDARLRLGPGPVGGAALIELDPRRTPLGPPAAPRVAAAVAWADATLDLGIGPLTPATSG